MAEPDIMLQATVMPFVYSFVIPALSQRFAHPAVHPCTTTKVIQLLPTHSQFVPPLVAYHSQLNGFKYSSCIYVAR